MQPLYATEAETIDSHIFFMVFKSLFENMVSPPKKKLIIFPKSVVLGVYGIWHTLFSDKPDVDHWIKNTAITTQEVMGGCFRRQQQATQSQLSAVRIRLESPISNTSAS